MEKRSGECEMLRVLRALIPCPSSFESKTEGMKSSEKNYNNINTTPTSTNQPDRGIIGETGAGTGGPMGVEKNKKLEVKGNKSDSSVGPEIHYESETEREREREKDQDREKQRKRQRERDREREREGGREKDMLFFMMILTIRFLQHKKPSVV